MIIIVTYKYLEIKNHKPIYIKIVLYDFKKSNIQYTKNIL